jgi:hypothetical protein
MRFLDDEGDDEKEQSEWVNVPVTLQVQVQAAWGFSSNNDFGWPFYVTLPREISHQELYARLLHALK